MTGATSLVGQRFALVALVALIGGCTGSAAPATSAVASSASPVLTPTSTPAASLAIESCLGVSPGQSSGIELTAGRDVRSVLVHVPRSARSGATKRAVVLMFHGYGDTPGAVQDMTGLSAKADDGEFVAAYPGAVGAPPKWDVAGETDIALVDALLTKLSADACVDSTRIYAVGMSMGGGMANVVACRLADRIAGLATVSGVYGPKWGDPCNAKRAVPVIAFHGVLDPQVPYAGGPIVDPEMGVGGNPDLPAVMGVEAWAAAWAARNGCGATVESQAPIGKVEPLFWTGCVAPVELYRVTDGGHTWPGSSWDEPLTNRDISATDLIWDFLSRFSLAGG